MIRDTDKTLLKRYRHITAALIESKTSKTISQISVNGISILRGNVDSTTITLFSTSTVKSSRARLNIAIALTSNLLLPSLTKILPVTNLSAQAGFDWRIAYAKDRQEIR